MICYSCGYVSLVRFDMLNNATFHCQTVVVVLNVLGSVRDTSAMPCATLSRSIAPVSPIHAVWATPSTQESRMQVALPSRFDKSHRLPVTARVPAVAPRHRHRHDCQSKCRYKILPYTLRTSRKHGWQCPTGNSYPTCATGASGQAIERRRQ
jgi:hypothetical protein